MKAKRERRLLFLLRMVLLIIGGCLGALIAWQIQQSVGVSFNIVIVYLSYGAGIVLFGGVLALSAGMFLSLARTVSFALRKKMSTVRAIDITGLVIGLVIGMVATIIIELLLQRVISILVLRVVIDIIAGLIVAFIAGYNCSVWLASDYGVEEKSRDDERKSNSKGYILTRNALRNDLIKTLCLDWLDGNIYITSTLAESLVLEANSENKTKESLVFKDLYQLNAIKTILVIGSFSEKDTILQTALNKKLKVIATKDDEIEGIRSSQITLLLIDEL